MSLRFPGHFFSSHSVTEGQPDKMCDQIADSILDLIVEEDPHARVACDVCIGGHLVVIMGEISTVAQPRYDMVARDAIKTIGYTREAGFDPADCVVVTSIREQSPDIAVGLATLDSRPPGAGDTCTVVGFACTDTNELMPAPIALAHKICMQLAEVRRTGLLEYLLPDGKAQVTIEYDSDTPLRVDSVTLLAQHAAYVEIEQLRSDLIDNVITPVLPQGYVDERTKIYVNPTGRVESTHILTLT